LQLVIMANGPAREPPAGPFPGEEGGFFTNKAGFRVWHEAFS